LRTTDSGPLFGPEQHEFDTGSWLGRGPRQCETRPIGEDGADHPSGDWAADLGVPLYLGEPVGFVLELENGYRLYHAGDTAVTSDMRLTGELYRPDLAMLPIGGHYTMGPREAAQAVELLGVKDVVPIHYGTFPILTGTPDELRGVGDCTGPSPRSSGHRATGAGQGPAPVVVAGGGRWARPLRGLRFG